MLSHIGIDVDNDNNNNNNNDTTTRPQNNDKHPLLLSAVGSVGTSLLPPPSAPLSTTTPLAVDNGPASIRINVKNAEDAILTIDLNPQDTIETLKNRILEEKGKKSHKVRLVYGGRLLADHQTILESKMTNNCYVISSITLPLSIGGTIASLPGGGATTTASPGVDMEVNHQQLLRAPLLLDQRLPRQGTEPSEFILEMEHHRNQILVSDAGFMSIQSSVLRDSLELLFGLTFGFFLGPISLFWLSKDYLARNVKLGIIAGVSFNILIGLTRVT
eukprot:gene3767-4343_t